MPHEVDLVQIGTQIAKLHWNVNSAYKNELFKTMCEYWHQVVTNTTDRNSSYCGGHGAIGARETADVWSLDPDGEQLIKDQCALTAGYIAGWCFQHKVEAKALLEATHLRNIYVSLCLEAGVEEAYYSALDTL